MDARRLAVKRRRLRTDTRGATAVEYGLIVALVVIVAVGAIIAVADVNTAIWNRVADKVTNPR